ncbi:hypothetical protein AGABI2DRAFT_181339, partial [Agaricus bisporus var. bisporus H97]|uniref:hypothetical protein n=1 Tax=Agaricus bisporus var. bisporus (strain H97 / ATCC MYA-4626 / FGSC 10389) TaxID=936046 RepID=UPI00029F6F74
MTKEIETTKETYTLDPRAGDGFLLAEATLPFLRADGAGAAGGYSADDLRYTGEAVRGWVKRLLLGGAIYKASMSKTPPPLYHQAIPFCLPLHSSYLVFWMPFFENARDFRWTDGRVTGVRPVTDETLGYSPDSDGRMFVIGQGDDYKVFVGMKVEAPLQYRRPHASNQESSSNTQTTGQPLPQSPAAQSHSSSSPSNISQQTGPPVSPLSDNTTLAQPSPDPRSGSRSSNSRNPQEATAILQEIEGL